MTSMTKYHYHLGKERAQRAADLAREAADEMHAAQALFALSVNDGESNMTHERDESERLIEQFEACWVEASQVGRM